MSRNYFVNGPTLLSCDGSELGLSDAPVQLGFNFRHENVMVNAWGTQIPPAMQFMLASVDITLTMVHFDPAVLQAMWTKSIAGPGNGIMPGAGALLYVPADYINLQITSPIGNLPWTFPTTFITAPPASWPLGTEKSLVSVLFRALPVPPGGDPYNGGNGSQGVVLWANS